jgi:hypothetical protein
MLSANAPGVITICTVATSKSVALRNGSQRRRRKQNVWSSDFRKSPTEPYFSCIQILFIYSITLMTSMASSSRTVVRAARTAVRPVVQQTAGSARRYASSADVETPETSTFDSSPQAVYVAPSAQRKAAEGAVMKKYTGPGFPKIPVSNHTMPTCCLADIYRASDTWFSRITLTCTLAHRCAS